MSEYLHMAYDEAAQTRQNVADEIEDAVNAACDRILPAHYMTEVTYQHLLQRVAELRTENERLLKAGEKWMGRAARFEEENAKLRELVADYDTAITRMCDQRKECGTCKLNDEDCSNCEAARLSSRMRELGVEADW